MIMIRLELSPNGMAFVLPKHVTHVVEAGTGCLVWLGNGQHLKCVHTADEVTSMLTDPVMPPVVVKHVVIEQDSPKHGGKSKR